MKPAHGTWPCFLARTTTSDAVAWVQSPFQMALQQSQKRQRKALRCSWNYPHMCSRSIVRPVLDKLIQDTYPLFIPLPLLGCQDVGAVEFLRGHQGPLVFLQAKLGIIRAHAVACTFSTIEPLISQRWKSSPLRAACFC